MRRWVSQICVSTRWPSGPVWPAAGIDQSEVFRPSVAPALRASVKKASMSPAPASPSSVWVMCQIGLTSPQAR